MLQPNTPRVFVSAVSSDLRSARRVVNEALTRIECLPVEESILGTEYGPISEILQRKIRACQAVIHLVGRDYGSEPDPQTLPTGHSRRSWTQIEYDLAKRLGKKLYLIVCDDAFPFDLVVTAEPDEKATFQNAHRAAVMADEHLWYTIRDFDELRQHVENLKVTLDEVREELGRQQSRHVLQTRLVAAAIFLVLSGVAWGVLVMIPRLIHQTSEDTVIDPEALATRTRDKIKADAEENISALPDEPGRWQKVAEIERQRDARLGRVDDLIELIRKGLKEGASPVLTRAIEILDKEGSDAALAYLENRRASTLDSARRHAQRAEAEKEQRNQTLQPLLLEANLLEMKLDWQSALKLRNTVAGLAPDWFDARNSLGLLQFRLARFPDAESHLRAALAVAANRDDEAVALNNLAGLLKATNRLEEAEPLMRRALTIDEQIHGAEHPSVARNLNNLAQLLYATNRLTEAEPLMRRALSISEQSYGAEHPHVAHAVNNLAALLKATNRLMEAEPLYRRALAIDKHFYGIEHPNVAIRLNNLAGLLRDTDRMAEAEPLYRRTLAIDEESYGAEHPKVATRLNNLAMLLKVTSRLVEAEPLMRRTIEILNRFDDATSGSHQHMQTALENYHDLLAAMDVPPDEIERRIEMARQSVGSLKPMTLEVERLLGPARPVADVLAGLDSQYNGNLAIWLLPLNEPISPHLDALLGPPPEDATE